MSKTYKCRIKKDIVESHRVSDEIEYNLGLLDILPPEEMEDIYKEAVKNSGGVEKEDKNLEISIDSITITIIPSEKKARVRISEEKKIAIHIDREEKVFEYSDSEVKAQKKAEEKADREINAELNKQKEDHINKVKKKLADSEEKVKEKLREISNEVHKNALRKKAGALGRINLDREEKLSEGDNRLTIEIEI